MPHTKEEQRCVEARAAELSAEKRFNPKSFLWMASQMDPPHGDRAAYWWAIHEYIRRLEKTLGVRSPHSPKIRR